MALRHKIRDTSILTDIRYILQFALAKKQSPAIALVSHYHWQLDPCPVVSVAQRVQAPNASPRPPVLQTHLLGKSGGS